MSHTVTIVEGVKRKDFEDMRVHLRETAREAVAMANVEMKTYTDKKRKPLDMKEGDCITATKSPDTSLCSQACSIVVRYLRLMPEVVGTLASDLLLLVICLVSPLAGPGFPPVLMLY